MSRLVTLQPDLLIIDSIQTIYTELVESSPGSVSQVRECSAAILKYAKESGVPVLLIGHINKEGSIAGRKYWNILSIPFFFSLKAINIICTVFSNYQNRFGSTAELGIYEMRQDGLREVSNPSELLLTQNHEGLSGVAIAAAIEGIRPFLIETQALVSSAVYGTPQRSATGFRFAKNEYAAGCVGETCRIQADTGRRVPEHCRGLKVNDPAIDLAVISYPLSSSLDISIEQGVCMCGEVGLSGGIRPVNRIEQRILEAEEVGLFTHHHPSQ